MTEMRCSRPVLDRLMGWLQDEGYIALRETYNPRRGRMETDIQVNPCALYIREEAQKYCESLWAGAERDYVQESTVRNLFSTKESQPESYPESVTRVSDQNQNHRRALSDKKSSGGAAQGAARTGQGPQIPQGKGKRHTAAMHDTAQGKAQPKQRNAQAQDVTDSSALVKFSTMDDEDLAQAIALTVATRIQQARQAVASYPRAVIESALHTTAAKRRRGELGNPGGYFFKLLQGESAPPPAAYPVNQDL